jgi:hypothetical protein
MSSALIPVVIVGGAGAYALTRGGTSTAAPQTPPKYGLAAFPGQPIPSAGAAPGVVATYGNAAVPGRKIQLGAATLHSIGALGAAPKITAWSSPANIDPQLQAKFDQIEAAAQKAYNDANEVAKAKAAEALNKDLKLDPPLTGHEDWKTVSAVVGGATGGAIGAAIGGPIGAKIGALAGAYLGVKLEDLIEKNLDEIKAWVSDTWGDVKDFASDAYDEVAGWVPW